MTRLVIDASVLLSAAVAAPDTPLALLMGAVRSGAVEMVVCDRLLGEVRRGLDSPTSEAASQTRSARTYRPRLPVPA